MDGFLQPFSKSLLYNLPAEYAVLVSQSLGEDSHLQLLDSIQEPAKFVHFSVHTGLVQFADKSFQLVIYFLH